MQLLRYIIILFLMPSLACAETITLPLKFHIMQDIVMQNKGQSMNVAITEQEIHSVILDEVNRIWKQADIQWKITDITSENSVDVPDKERQLNYVANTGRDEDGKSDKKRLPVLYNMIDKSKLSNSSFNIYLFPFLGNASQGNTNRRKNIILIGTWSNKSSGGEDRPQMAKLVEPEPFTQGSIGRTIAHELGHMLSLQHPDKQTQTEFNRLMGGKMQGYTLTQDEISNARKSAQSF